MKGLVIKKKWLDLILAGKKIWEIRGSNCRLRGRVALIESGSGTIVAVCSIKGVQGPFSLPQLLDHRKNHAVDKETLETWGGYAKNFCWELDDVVILAEPIPYIHPMGAVIWVGEASIPQKKLAKQLGYERKG